MRKQLEQSNMVLSQEENNLSIVIMASRKREAWAIELSKKLNNCPIAFDPHTRFNISNIWENCRRAWMMQDMTKEWGLVIQDDAILCDGFIEKAKEHLRKAKGCAIQFYLGNNPQYEEQFREFRKNGFIKKVELSWGVAIAMETALIPKMISFGNADGAWQDDIKIKHFLIKNHIPTYYPIPGLVDHRRDNESLVKSKNKNRFSNFFIDNI